MLVVVQLYSWWLKTENGAEFAGKMLDDARGKIEAWCIHYNQRRPHSALGQMTPYEFAEKSASCQNMQPT